MEQTMPNLPNNVYNLTTENYVFVDLEPEIMTFLASLDEECHEDYEIVTDDVVKTQQEPTNREASSNKEKNVCKKGKEQADHYENDQEQKSYIFDLEPEIMDDIDIIIKFDEPDIEWDNMGYDQ